MKTLTILVLAIAAIVATEANAQTVVLNGIPQPQIAAELYGANVPPRLIAFGTIVKPPSITRVMIEENRSWFFRYYTVNVWGEDGASWYSLSPYGTFKTRRGQVVISR